MKTLKITDFKTRALQVLAEVAARKEGILVTKRGKPIGGHATIGV